MNSGVERVLFRLEDEWAQALVLRDAKTFRRLIQSAWTYSDERATIGREAAIAEFTSGPDTVVAANNEGMRAHVDGSTAVVTGILATRGHGAEGPFVRRYRYTDTWLFRHGRWRAIASQDCVIGPPGSPSTPGA
ncbi:MAG: hypothetical protein NVS4B3_19010 [Gemmatimonadaceae bacterium]